MGTEKKIHRPNPLSDELCAEVLKALADPLRLKVIRALTGNTFTVTDLGLLLETQVTNISHHLRVLYHAGLVTTTRDGKYIYYQLNQNYYRAARSSGVFDFGCCHFNLECVS